MKNKKENTDAERHGSQRKDTNRTIRKRSKGGGSSVKKKKMTVFGSPFRLTRFIVSVNQICCCISYWQQLWKVSNKLSYQANQQTMFSVRHFLSGDPIET